MGRPLNKKWFGNTNTPAIGGEGVASVTVAGTNNNYSAFPTVAFAAPSLPDGVQATGTVRAGVVSVTLNTDNSSDYVAGDELEIVGGTGTAAVITVDTVEDVTGKILTYNLTSAGNYSALPDLTDLALTGSVDGVGAIATITALKINSIEMTNNGSGYTSAPAVTDTPDGNATLTAVLSAVKGNAIVAYAQTTSGGSNKIADIDKQVSGRRYRVKTADGVAVCTLVTDGVANAAGEMTITATDANSNTYYVKKLTARRATLVRIAGGSNYVYADDQSAPWSFDAATGVYVQIANN